MLKGLGIIGPLLIVIVVFLLLQVCDDRREENFARLAESGDAISRGWLPSWIASDATDIRLLHDLDTNETWGAFRFGDAGARELAEACKDVPDTSVPFPRSPEAKWWPPVLLNTSDTCEGYRIMKCQQRSLGSPGRWETSDAFAAVSHNTRATYFWRVGH